MRSLLHPVASLRMACGLGFVGALSCGASTASKSERHPPSVESSRDAAGVPGAGASFPLEDSGSGQSSISEGSGCRSFECTVPDCQPAGTTSLSGIVRAPAGDLPLYDVLVYVPRQALEPLPQGVRCEPCTANTTLDVVASAVTDSGGRFTLEDVPAGRDIPLVMEHGKWRRQVTIPEVLPCQDNLVADPELTRLPRDRSEGDLPQMAVVTGANDSLECLLRRFGVADSEFTDGAGGGRVHLYVGGTSSDGQGAIELDSALGGARFTSAADTLWSSASRMLDYDLMLFSCDGDALGEEKAPYHDNLEAYVDAGGRLLLTHAQRVWLTEGPFQGTANFVEGLYDPPPPAPAFVDESFPKGAALAQWLFELEATPTRGQFPLHDARHSIGGVMAPTQRWLEVPAEFAFSPTMLEDIVATQLLTFNAPLGSAPSEQCGRVALFDHHFDAGQVVRNSRSDPSIPFPTGCTENPWAPEDLVFAFSLFDLSGCVRPDVEAGL